MSGPEPLSGRPAARARLLVVGHTYAASENRKKIQALATHFDLCCVTSQLDDGEILDRKAADFDNDSDADDRNYDLQRLAPKKGNTTTFRYTGLGAIMRARKFDVVLVENEPWSLIRWQTRFQAWLWQRQALFGEFTWENVERPGVKGAVLRAAYRAMTTTTDFVICGNQAAASLVTQRGLRAQDILVAPQLGVDLASHRAADAEERSVLRAKAGLPLDAFIVGFAGRFTEEKGLRDLLAACDALHSEEKHEDLHLALIGSGPLGDALRHAATTRPWLHLLPPRPHFEIPDFLRCLDVFVLASKPLQSAGQVWEEQFGHALIEAMACGVATLGSHSGAIPEVLGNADAIFPCGDVQTLAARLTQLKDNPMARQLMADRQAARVREHYTHEVIAAQWAAFIQKKLAA